MRRIFVPANSNNEYEHKAEWIRLSSIVFPEKTTFRWDKPERTLNNFLWFFKFELSFISKAAEIRRKEIWENNTGKEYKVKNA